MSESLPEISGLRVLGDSLPGEVTSGEEEGGPEVDAAGPARRGE